jgi:hypothetical protein
MFIDHLDLAPSASGYKLRIQCPRCNEAHEVTISKLRRFMFRCGDSEMSGELNRDPSKESRLEEYREEK